MAKTPSPLNFQSQFLMAAIEDVNHKMLSQNVSLVQFELRKKQFQEDHADWFALQNEYFEAHGLWCDGLVPWMSASFFDGFSAD